MVSALAFLQLGCNYVISRHARAFRSEVRIIRHRAAALVGVDSITLGGCMLRQSYLAAILGLSLCCGQTISASAQQSDGPDGFYEYARNKIGLLRYCRDQALLGQVTADRAVVSIENALGRVAVINDLIKERGDKAEKAGQAGLWEEANGRRDLASVADQFGTTTANLCKELSGQTRAVQQPSVISQVAPKAATSEQVDLNANRSIASIKPAATPTVPTINVVSAPAAARSPKAYVEPAPPSAASTIPVASIPAVVRSPTVSVETACP
jgi:hypothetical protein